MAQITYRANLSAKSFPLLAENFGRTVIATGQDQNYSRTSFSAEDLDKDKGIPQIYYCHNVMPHQEGLQSIGYNEILPSSGTTGFDRITLIRDDADNKIFLGVKVAAGTNTFYVSDGTGAAWVPKITVGGGLVTSAYVAGVCYIYIAYYGCYKYNFLTGAFDAVILAGINYDLVTGICAASGYLIAWTKGVAGQTKTATFIAGTTVIPLADTTDIVVGQVISGAGIADGTKVEAVILASGGGPAIWLDQVTTAAGTGVTLTFEPSTSTLAWSSTTDPTDFIPSPNSGAGGGPLEQAKGSIKFCVPHTLGFIVGTADNCIVALYQSNQLFPFQFRELVNSGGLTSLDLISWDANSSGLYAYTTSGMQLISTQQTQTVLTEITDFIAGLNFEDFNDTTKEFEHTVLTSPMQKRLTVAVDRYLVISYGMTSLTHAIVFDLVTKRYGKLKLDHVQCFTYQLESGAIVETPRQSIGFLKSNGSVVTVDFNISAPASDGTLILGKYQYVRARNLVMDTIAFESTRASQNFELTLMTALDGKNTVNSTPTLTYSSGLAREYSCRAEGKNHSLLCQGGFIVDSLVLQFHLGGKR